MGKMSSNFLRRHYPHQVQRVEVLASSQPEKRAPPIYRIFLRLYRYDISMSSGRIASRKNLTEKKQCVLCLIPSDQTRFII